MKKKKVNRAKTFPERRIIMKEEKEDKVKELKEDKKVEEDKKIEEPQMSFRWQIVLPEVLGTDWQLVSKRVTKIHNFSIVPPDNEITLEVDEYEDGKTLKYFSEWMASHEKKSVLVQFMKATGQTFKALQIQNFYPIRVQHPVLIMEETNVLKYIVVLSGKILKFEP